MMKLFCRLVLVCTLLCAPLFALAEPPISEKVDADKVSEVYRTGYSQGYSDAYREAYREGHKDGFKLGFEQGRIDKRESP